MSGKEDKYKFIEECKFIKKILGWLDIDEFKRARHPPKKLSATDLFDDFAQNDCIGSAYTDF